VEPQPIQPVSAARSRAEVVVMVRKDLLL